MIIPSVLESNLKQFQSRLKEILTLKGIKYIQVDFADGEFVPTKTVSVEEFKLPKTRVKFEAHLMVNEPKSFEAYKKAGFDKIILHYESFGSEADLEEALDEIRKLKMTPALAISPTTSVSVLRYFSDNVLDFTLLTVVPGRQGQPMLPDAHDRLMELHDHSKTGCVLEIDGGVNSENIASLIDAGATQCVVGSALGNGTMKEDYQRLLEAINNG